MMWINFSTLKNWIEALNITSSVKFKIIEKKGASCEIFSIKGENEIIVGECLPTYLYLYNFCSENIHINYLRQSIYAQFGLYDRALQILCDLNKRANTEFEIEGIDINQRMVSEFLHLCIFKLAIFHEIGHLVFSKCENVRCSYFNSVSQHLEDLRPKAQKLYKHSSLGKIIFQGFELDNSNQYDMKEEIACDYYAIDTIFKTKPIFSEEEILLYCLSLIQLQCCTYLLEFFNQVSRGNHDKIWDDILIKFSFRRMVVFHRMMEVLEADYGIDPEEFNSICMEISPSIGDVSLILRLAAQMWDEIQSRDFSKLNKNKKEYFNVLKAFNERIEKIGNPSDDI